MKRLLLKIRSIYVDVQSVVITIIHLNLKCVNVYVCIRKSLKETKIFGRKNENENAIRLSIVVQNNCGSKN